MSAELTAVIVALHGILLAPAVAGVSPVNTRIEAARKRVAAEPSSAQAFDELAAALCRKGRDRNDVAIYEEAEKALNHALELAPGSYQARKLQVTVLLGKQQYKSALQLAKELNRKVPDDIEAWGFLVDANAALGEYAEAERCAQWILDLRPGSTLGFVKAAGLRELFGDREGTIEFLEEANRRTSRNDADERAWLVTEIARQQVEAGQVSIAERLLGDAAALIPDSQHLLEIQGRLATAKGDYAGAATLYETRYRAVPNATNLFDWAESLERRGSKEQAAAAFQDFERHARAACGKPGNADVQLVFYLADRAGRPADALQLASELFQARQDTETLHAFAWALHQNGKFPEAHTQMQRALAPGIRKAIYFCHAAEIAAASNHAAEYEKYSKELSTLPKGRCSTKESGHLATRTLP